MSFPLETHQSRLAQPGQWVTLEPQSLNLFLCTSSETHKWESGEIKTCSKENTLQDLNGNSFIFVFSEFDDPRKICYTHKIISVKSNPKFPCPIPKKLFALTILSQADYEERLKARKRAIIQNLETVLPLVGLPEMVADFCH